MRASALGASATGGSRFVVIVQQNAALFSIPGGQKGRCPASARGMLPWGLSVVWPATVPWDGQGAAERGSLPALVELWRPEGGGGGTGLAGLRQWAGGFAGQKGRIV